MSPLGTGGEFVGAASAPTASSSGAIKVQAQTPAAGFALQNATPTILSWTAPNDGKLHMFTVQAMLLVTVTEVGGACFLTWTSGGQAFNSNLISGANTPSSTNITAVSGQADPGTTVTLHQTGALTSGAAAVFASLLGE